MFKKPNCPVIAIEEHYWDAELSKTYTGVESGRPGPQQERLFDLGALRVKEMDETGIDMQVISHGAPSAQKLSGDGAVALVQRVNDRLAAACAANPERFLGFAALPTCDPKAAADELERCRKIGTFSKVVMAGGAVWLAAGLLGFVYLGAATLGAIAAILGGIVLNGSNRSTMQQLQAAIDAAENERSALIGTIDLRIVEADERRSNDTVRWLH